VEVGSASVASREGVGVAVGLTVPGGGRLGVWVAVGAADDVADGEGVPVTDGGVVVGVAVPGVGVVVVAVASTG
jgi:hypothetical protein